MFQLVPVGTSMGLRRAPTPSTKRHCFNWCCSAPQWDSERWMIRKLICRLVSIGATRHLNGTGPLGFAVQKCSGFNWCHSAPQWDGIEIAEDGWFQVFQLVPLGTSMGLS